MLEKYLSDGIFPHLLFYGKAGTGKTTIARILTKKCDCEVLELNASDERGIDTIRDKIGDFVKSKTMRKFKVVFLDEGDNLTTPAQQTLRALMEKFHNNARFIFTGNYANKIIDPIKSRCVQIELKALNRKEMQKRLAFILQNEKIEYVESDIEKILQLSQFDLRQAISNLQRFSKTEKLIIEENNNEFAEIIGLMNAKKIPELKEYLATNEVNYQKLYRFLFKKETDLKRLGLIAKFYYQNGFVADEQINFTGLAIEW